MDLIFKNMSVIQFPLKDLVKFLNHYAHNSILNENKFKMVAPNNKRKTSLKQNSFRIT